MSYLFTHHLDSLDCFQMSSAGSVLAMALLRYYWESLQLIYSAP